MNAEIISFILNSHTLPHIQGVPLILVKTLKGGRGHEDKHYSVGNHGEQTSSAGARGR